MLTNNECKYIATFAIWAFTNTFRRKNEDFHLYYHLSNNEEYIPTEKEIDLVCKEFERLEKILRKRMNQLTKKRVK